MAHNVPERGKDQEQHYVSLSSFRLAFDWAVRFMRDLLLSAVGCRERYEHSTSMTAHAPAQIHIQIAQKPCCSLFGSP